MLQGPVDAPSQRAAVARRAFPPPLLEGDSERVRQTPPHHVVPRAATAFLFGTPAGPEWGRGGGPSVPSPATWLPGGGGGVEGAGGEQEGQREKRLFPPLSPPRSFPPVVSSTTFFLFVFVQFRP